MKKKDQIRQNTILGVSALVFMAMLLIMTWISDRIPAKIYKERSRS
jgi:hypothetical protein